MKLFFEFFGLLYFEDFSNVCHESGLYFYLTLVVIVTSISTNIIYYLIIDSSNLNKINYFFLVLISTFSLVNLFTFYLTRSVITNEGLVFSNLPYFSLSTITGFYGIFFQFISSLFIKNFSKNTYRIPF